MSSTIESTKIGAKFYRSEILRIMGAKPTKENVLRWFDLDLDMRQTKSLCLAWEYASELEQSREAIAQGLVKNIQNLAQSLELKNQEIADLKVEHESQINTLNEVIRGKDEAIANLKADLEIATSIPPEAAPVQTEILFDSMSDEERFAKAVFLLPYTESKDSPYQGIVHALLDTIFSQAADRKKLYRQLVPFFHPDVVADKATAQILIKDFNNSYERPKSQQQQESDNSIRYYSEQECRDLQRQMDELADEVFGEFMRG